MHEPQRLHSTCLTMLPRFHSTPLLLQGGDVGQQAFMVELLQLQELNGPLVWWGWQLKSHTHSNNTYRAFTPSPRGHKHTRPPYREVDRLLLSGQPQKHNWRKPYRCGPSGFEPKYGQHPETAHNNTGRYWEVQMSTSLKQKDTLVGYSLPWPGRSLQSENKQHED